MWRLRRSRGSVIGRARGISDMAKSFPAPSRVLNLWKGLEPLYSPIDGVARCGNRTQHQCCGLRRGGSTAHLGNCLPSTSPNMPYRGLPQRGCLLEVGTSTATAAGSRYRGMHRVEILNKRWRALQVGSLSLQTSPFTSKRYKRVRIAGTSASRHRAAGSTCRSAPISHASRRSSKLHSHGRRTPRSRASSSMSGSGNANVGAAHCKVGSSYRSEPIQEIRLNCSRFVRVARRLWCPYIRILNSPLMGTRNRRHPSPLRAFPSDWLVCAACGRFTHSFQHERAGRPFFVFRAGSALQTAGSRQCRALE